MGGSSQVTNFEQFTSSITCPECCCMRACFGRRTGRIGEGKWSGRGGRFRSEFPARSDRLHEAFGSRFGIAREERVLHVDRPGGASPSPTTVLPRFVTPCSDVRNLLLLIWRRWFC